AAVIGDRVVPEADLVDIAAGRQRGSRRHADRRIAIGVGEAHAASRQPVEIRRPDHRVTVTTEYPPAVLVRQNEQQVRGFHRPPIPRPPPPPPAPTPPGSGCRGTARRPPP